jgi:transposase
MAARTFLFAGSRERVLESDGLTCAQAAERYSVSISYVVKARARRTGRAC